MDERERVLRVMIDRARRRRGLRFIAKWAAARAVVCAAVGAWTGEYQLAAMAFAVFTWFHVERVTGDWS